MREFKFRVWDPNHEAMHSSADASLEWLFGLVERHGATVMQYTGLKDVMGREIYEGDILEYKALFGNRPKVVIEYHAPSFYMRMLDPESTLKFRTWVDDAEIITNVFERPEVIR